MDRYPDIGDHGLIGDLQTAALVSADGTVDWFCAVALDRHTVAVLREHRHLQLDEREQRLAAGKIWHDSGYVFVRPDGTPIHPGYVTQRLAKLVKEACVPPVQLHDLRHGAASMAHEAGADLKSIQDQLGHLSIVVTADTYTSVLPLV